MWILIYWHTYVWTACVYPCSSPLTAWDVLQGSGTSVTQRQKFHTDDINQCLHNKSFSAWVPNVNFFNFTFLLVDFGYTINPLVLGFQMQISSILHFSWSILVKCCVHLRTSSSKTLMLLVEKNIFYKYWLFCYRFIARRNTCTSKAKPMGDCI